ALVGASGAGKTTVTKLLMRYADPQQGQISIGGVDIRRLTPEQRINDRIKTGKGDPLHECRQQQRQHTASQHPGLTANAGDKLA
ncbi:ATP-binding cassette domain-containing protein, partial [Klebsiella pneumoniae]|uniref:ATP-binding cassette domain-containing protein n=1 Tax=Klebsiella pneumoniae TaxID=573 RepID=UPI00214CC75D